MTLEQIKNEYAVSMEFEDWSEFQNHYASRHPEYFENHWHNVIELAQKECLKRASERLIWKEDKELLEDITNENNIIK